MKIKTTTKLWNMIYELELDEKSEIDTLHKAIVLSNPPQTCNACQKNDERFRLDSNKDKEGNTYINVVCVACGAKAKLGQYKSGGYFWHKFEVYVKEVK